MFAPNNILIRILFITGVTFSLTSLGCGLGFATQSAEVIDSMQVNPDVLTGDPDLSRSQLLRRESIPGIFAKPVVRPAPNLIISPAVTNESVILDSESETELSPEQGPIPNPITILPTKTLTSFDHNRQGKDYYNAGSYDQALNEFSAAIKIRADDSDAYLYRGLAHYKLGNYEEGLINLNRAIQLTYGHAKIYRARGQIFDSLNKHLEAIKDYSQAIILDDDNAEIYFKRGASYRHLDEINKSNLDYSKACQLDQIYCSTLTSLNICPENERESNHLFYGQADGILVSAWVEDVKIASARTGAAVKINSPYSLLVPVCDPKGHSRIGKTVRFKTDQKWTLKSSVIRRNGKDKINLTYFMPPPTPRFATPTPNVPTPSPLPPSTDMRISNDGMEVSLTKISRAIVDDINYVTISYSLKNTTSKSLTFKGWKLYFFDNGGIAQEYDFREVLPGKTIEGMYTFRITYPHIPFVLAYPATEGYTWGDEALTWNID